MMRYDFFRITTGNSFPTPDEEELIEKHNINLFWVTRDSIKERSVFDKTDLSHVGPMVGDKISLQELR